MNEKVVAIIPIRGSDEEFQQGIPLLGGKPLIEYTVQAARESRLLNRVIVSTDSPAIAQACREVQAEAPFLRPASLSQPSVSETDVLKHCVEWLEHQEGYRADWVVKLEITHPFRPRGVIDRVIETAYSTRVDSAFLVYEDQNSYWTLDESGQPQQIGEEVDVPRKVRRPFYRDLSGLVAITRAANLLKGKLYGRNIGLIPLRDLFAIVDTHEGHGSASERVGYRLAELLAPEYNRKRILEGVL